MDSPSRLRQQATTPRRSSRTPAGFQQSQPLFWQPSTDTEFHLTPARAANSQLRAWDRQARSSNAQKGRKIWKRPKQSQACSQDKENNDVALAPSKDQTGHEHRSPQKIVKKVRLGGAPGSVLLPFDKRVARAVGWDRRGSGLPHKLRVRHDAVDPPSEAKLHPDSEPSLDHDRLEQSSNSRGASQERSIASLAGAVPPSPELPFRHCPVPAQEDPSDFDVHSCDENAHTTGVDTFESGPHDADGDPGVAIDRANTSPGDRSPSTVGEPVTSTREPIDQSAKQNPEDAVLQSSELLLPAQTIEVGSDTEVTLRDVTSVRLSPLPNNNNNNDTTGDGLTEVVVESSEEHHADSQAVDRSEGELLHTPDHTQDEGSCPQHATEMDLPNGIETPADVIEINAGICPGAISEERAEKDDFVNDKGVVCEPTSLSTRPDVTETSDEQSELYDSISPVALNTLERNAEIQPETPTRNASPGYRSTMTTINDSSHSPAGQSVTTTMHNLDSRLESPSLPECPLTPGSVSVKVNLNDDESVLHAFLSRAKASKAARIATRSSASHKRDSDAVKTALASPKPATSISDDLDPASPSTFRSDATDWMGTSTSAVDDEALASPTLTLAQAPSLSSSRQTVEAAAVADMAPRRSKRGMSPKLVDATSPDQTQPVRAAPQTITVRRPDGSDRLTLQKTEAQRLSQSTRSNTNRNKAGAVPVRSMLMKLKDDKSITETSPAAPADEAISANPARKGVRWNEDLVSFFQEGGKGGPKVDEFALEDITTAASQVIASQPPNPHPDASSVANSKPRVKRARALGAMNGTPAKPKPIKSSVVTDATQTVEPIQAESVSSSKPPATRTRTRRGVHTSPTSDTAAVNNGAFPEDPTSAPEQTEPRPSKRPRRLLSPTKRQTNTKDDAFSSVEHPQSNTIAGTSSVDKSTSSKADVKPTSKGAAVPKYGATGPRRSGLPRPGRAGR